MEKYFPRLNTTNVMIILFFSFQATCKFECYIQEALLVTKKEDQCLPWYYPQVDPKARLCSPFEAIEFKKMIDTMSDKKCQVD